MSMPFLSPAQPPCCRLALRVSCSSSSSVPFLGPPVSPSVSLSAAPRKVRPADSQVFYFETAKDDEVLARLVADRAPAEGEEKVVVAVTDAVLTQLMASTRSVYPWDIVITYLGRGMVFMDARKPFDTVRHAACHAAVVPLLLRCSAAARSCRFLLALLCVLPTAPSIFLPSCLLLNAAYCCCFLLLQEALTVNENAHAPPVEDEEADPLNNRTALSQEATYLHQAFTQQVRRHGTAATCWYRAPCRSWGVLRRLRWLVQATAVRPAPVCLRVW